MDPRDVFQVLLGVCGLLLASYGLRLLLTRRLPPFARRRWNRPLDAGMWFLCGGLCFLLVAAGYLGQLAGAFGPTTSLVLVALAALFLAVGLIRYRPRTSTTGRPSDAR